MAAKKVFEEFKPIFGEAMAERDSGPVAAPSALLRPFVFYVHALDPYRLEIAATDFCSHALERVLTVQDVEDLVSQTLYRSFREKHGEVVKEQLRCLQLEKLLHLEKEKTECLQKQLDSHSFKRKASRPKSSDKAVTVSELSNVEPLVNSEVQQPSEGPTDKDTSSMKASQRVVPAYRRAKVRGALLQDTDDNDDD